MKFLAIDIGQKRIGIASCDRLELAATPHSFVPADKTAPAAIAHLIESEGADGLVVGLPLSMDGSERDACERVRAFMARVRSLLKVPFWYVDERMTTKIAEASLIEADIRREKRRELRDAVAASLILQQFIDCRRAGRTLPPEP